jgi:hypothetical protein
MGNMNRAMTYDRAANVANAIQALDLDGTLLKWHRLDDGVMGGRSETLLSNSKLLLAGKELSGLHFKGYINTEGGGFTSIRTPLDPTVLFPTSIVPETDVVGNIAAADSSSSLKELALRLTYRGDGKTYKVLLSDGSPSVLGASPSWQVDLPTQSLSDTEPSQISTLTLDQFQPAFGGGRSSRSMTKEEMRLKYKLDPRQMKQLGLMLSLRLSDGSPNPKETFGQGIFDFSLFVESIELIHSPSNHKKKTMQKSTESEADKKTKNEL